LKEQHRLYMIEQLKQLMAIDSIAGFTHEIEAYLHEEIIKIGFEPKHTIKDARFPYNYETVTTLKEAAERDGIAYALDMYLPGYGSDSDITITAGYDVKHSCIGPGVLVTTVMNVPTWMRWSAPGS